MATSIYDLILLKENWNHRIIQNILPNKITFFLKLYVFLSLITYLFIVFI